MKMKLFAVTSLVAAILIGCSGGDTNEGSNQNENETKNIKELVHDYSVGNKSALRASITSQQLVVYESAGSEIIYDLPEDEFFVSIAPYINETHP
jgi:outer membrane lipoprotein SlyB